MEFLFTFGWLWLVSNLNTFDGVFMYELASDTQRRTCHVSIKC